MIAQQAGSRTLAMMGRAVSVALVAFVGILLAVLPTPLAFGEQRGIGPYREHVRELARYLEHLEVDAPVYYQRLAVFPVRLLNGDTLLGSWLTTDEAMTRGVLVVREKSHASVPTVSVENRSRDDMVYIMGGEVLAGGKQTRTVRQDVVLSPGESVELQVFCVEPRRWAGNAQFRAGNILVPQSIQKSLRQGADQQQVWSEVARNNRALDAETETGSLEAALNSADVKDRLARVRAKIVPEMPRDTVGFIFVFSRRAVGADFFGRSDLAQTLLPKLLDSYSVDCVLQQPNSAPGDEKARETVALEFLDRIRAAGSHRVSTMGSGAGIRTSGRELFGDGISLGGVVVHYGVQIPDRIVPLPKVRN